MKKLNKIIKGILFVLTYVWAIISLFLASVWLVCTVLGVVAFICSLVMHSIPACIGLYSWAVVLIASVPLTIILFFTSIYKVIKKDKPKKTEE